MPLTSSDPSCTHRNNDGYGKLYPPGLPFSPRGRNSNGGSQRVTEAHHIGLVDDPDNQRYDRRSNQDEKDGVVKGFEKQGAKALHWDLGEGVGAVRLPQKLDLARGQTEVNVDAEDPGEAKGTVKVFVQSLSVLLFFLFENGSRKYNEVLRFSACWCTEFAPFI